MSAWSLIRNDVRLQLRHGIYAAYAFVALAYVVLMRLLPADARVIALPPLLLTEVTIIGFFFAGTLLLFERGDGTLTALGATPLSPLQYLLAKWLSLSFAMALTSMAIAWGALGSRVRPLPLIVTATLIAAAFVPAGLAVASRFTKLERFVVLGGLASAVLGLPVVPYLGALESTFWVAVPTTGALALLACSTDAPGVSVASLIFGGAILAGWAVIAFLIARRWVTRYGLGREGLTGD